MRNIFIRISLVNFFIFYFCLSCLSQKTYESSYCFDTNAEMKRNCINLSQYPNDSLLTKVNFVELWVKKDTLIWNYIKPFVNMEELHVPVLNQKSLKIPSTICSLKKIKVIYHLRKRTIFPSCFNTLEELEELSIPWSKFKTIPPEIYNLPNLKILRIGQYVGKDLPKELANMKTLEKLEISNLHNRIRKVSPAIYELNNLKSLSLYTKKYVSLEDKFIKLGNLNFFYLNIDLSNENTLKILSNMKNLNGIGVVNLSEIPQDIEKLSFIETLTIDKSKLNIQQRKKFKSLLPNTKITFSDE